MGLSGFPGQACLEQQPTVLLLLAMDLGWLPNVLLTTTGFVSFRPQDCLPSGGTLQHRIAQCDHSAAKRHRFASLDGRCLSSTVYGLNDAPRRWWNRLDKFLVSIGLEPTRADRCTYVGYQGIESQKPKPYKAKLVQEEGSPFGEESSMYSDSAGSYLKEVALSALNCYAHDEDSQSTSDTAEERSYMSCPDIAACFNSAHTKKMVDYAWRPVTDSKLLGFLGGVAHKKRGWFPYENGQALVSHRAKALRGPEPTFKVKDYPYRVSFVLRQGTWWVVERAQDLRIENKPCYLEEKLKSWSPCSFGKGLL